MIDPTGVQQADELADVMPAYNADFMRLNAGLSEEQGGDLAPYLRAAIRPFQTDTSLKVYRHSFTYGFSGEHLVVDPGRSILVPGFDCSITAFTCDGMPVDQSLYRQKTNWQTGSAIIEPIDRWAVNRKSRIEISFSAGLTELPAELQQVLATRIRYNVWKQTGDLISYNADRKSYTVGVIAFE